MAFTEAAHIFDLYFLIYMCFLIVLIGLVMGSFLNCTAIRICNGESISRGRSHCMECGHVLGVMDLIPVVSWFALRGRCRYCGAHVSARYPATEIVTAIVYLSVVVKYGFTDETIEMLILWSFLLCISFSDIEDYLIPDRFILAGIILRIVYIFMAALFPIGENSQGFAATMQHLGWQSIIGGLCISFPLMLVVLVLERVFKKDMMGGGDIKLLFMIGIYFTWQINFFSIFIACVAGIIGGVILKKKGVLDIPFGPFIVGGAWVGMFVGQAVLDFYFTLF